jgi:hypothetical protein
VLKHKEEKKELEINRRGKSKKTQEVGVLSSINAYKMELILGEAEFN